MSFVDQIVKWKTAAGAVVGGVILVLQVVNVLLSSDIDSALYRKSNDLYNKAVQIGAILDQSNVKTDKLTTLVQSNAQQSQNNGSKLAVINEQIANNRERHEEILRQMAALKHELDELDQKH